MFGVFRTSDFVVVAWSFGALLCSSLLLYYSGRLFIIIIITHPCILSYLSSPASPSSHRMTDRDLTDQQLVAELTQRAGQSFTIIFRGTDQTNSTNCLSLYCGSNPEFYNMHFNSKQQSLVVIHSSFSFVVFLSVYFVKCWWTFLWSKEFT